MNTTLHHLSIAISVKGSRVSSSDAESLSIHHKPYSYVCLLVHVLRVTLTLPRRIDPGMVHAHESLDVVPSPGHVFLQIQNLENVIHTMGRVHACMSFASCLCYAYLAGRLDCARMPLHATLHLLLAWIVVRLIPYSIVFVCPSSILFLLQERRKSKSRPTKNSNLGRREEGGLVVVVVVVVVVPVLFSSWPITHHRH